MTRDDHVELEMADVLGDMGFGVAGEVDKVLADAYAGMKMAARTMEEGMASKSAGSDGSEVGVEVVDDQVGELLREFEDWALHRWPGCCGRRWRWRGLR